MLQADAAGGHCAVASSAAASSSSWSGFARAFGSTSKVVPLAATETEAPRCGGPEDAGGPSPPSDEDSQNSEGAASVTPELLLRSLAEEPFETVFEDPLSGDAVCLLRNLDTGEARPLSPKSLTESFLGVQCDPRVLLKSVATPWRNWWVQKRRKDEELLLAAEAGDAARLLELLAPGDGGPPASANAQRQAEEGTRTPSSESAGGGTLRRQQTVRPLAGATALHLAAGAGQPKAVEVLLAAGATVDVCTDALAAGGLTPLHIAASRGHVEVVGLLLDSGADPNFLSEDRNLALHLASANGQAAAVALLLERGGFEQLAVRNELGQLPAEAAMDARTAILFRQYHQVRSPRTSRSGASTGTWTQRFFGTAQRVSFCLGEEEGGPDQYAERTPLQEAGVLLRNARADAVHRLLSRTQQPAESGVCASGGASGSGSRGALDFCRPRSKGLSPRIGNIESPAHGSRSPAKGAAGLGTPKALRAPFARVRRGSSKEEKVGPNSFELVKLLGRGSFGEVFQVKHKISQKDYAMKVLQKSRILSSNLLRYAVTERNILAYVRHPYIVSLHYAFQTPSHLVLVLQYCPRGNLQHLICREKRLREPLAQLYTAEILLALIHLHERQTVFRDLKPDNVVLDEANHAMLTDFGLSKEGVLGQRGTKSFCGSVAFLAPEILLRKGHGHTVDIYNLGVMLYDMLTGLPPFYHQDRETLFANIKHARLEVPQYVSRIAHSFIDVTMDRDPGRRLGAARTSDVKEHIFFHEIDFAALMRREVPVPGTSAREEHLLPFMSDRHVALGLGGRAPESPFARADRAAGWRARYSRNAPTITAGEADGGVSGWEFAAVPPGSPTATASAFSASVPSTEGGSGSSSRRGFLRRAPSSPESLPEH